MVFTSSSRSSRMRPLGAVLLCAWVSSLLGFSCDPNDLVITLPAPGQLSSLGPVTVSFTVPVDARPESLVLLVDGEPASLAASTTSGRLLSGQLEDLIGGTPRVGPNG